VNRPSAKTIKKNQNERPGTHPDRDRRPQTARAHRSRRPPGPDHDGRPVLHPRGSEGPQRADPGDPPRQGPRPGPSGSVSASACSSVI